jgi:hypothetical protein
MGERWRCGLRYAGVTLRPRFEARRFSMPAQPRIRAQPGRYGTSIANGDLSFPTLCDFKELRVAKIAHSATSALTTSRQPSSRTNRCFEELQDFDSAQRKTASNYSSR